MEWKVGNITISSNSEKSFPIGIVDRIISKVIHYVADPVLLTKTNFLFPSVGVLLELQNT